jgi:UDP-N-acetylmuramyl tripeptide synthase
MNIYNDQKQVKYFIDYAHTPAALNAVLKFLQETKNNNSKVITVFGAP